jgi:haloacetate dehalogenase
MIDGFEEHRLGVGESVYLVGVSGTGPPVLLLHGFPQTHHAWRLIAKELTAQRSVVVADLKGVGESRAPKGGPLGEGYSKRELAAELIDLMAQLGHERFAVVGHDRGARVAYRMALDHSDTVERLAVVNIVPTSDQFTRMAEAPSTDYYPWFLLAQPAPFPERLLEASADYFVRHVMQSWAAEPEAIDTEAVETYVRAFTSDTISAWCSDYRASFHTDREMDAGDLDVGRRIACPVIVHWGSEEGALATALATWRRWAAHAQGGPLPGGHFVPEEAPAELAASLRAFLG